ncbi:MAG: hypothetical protein IJ721_04120 [Bacteroidales bacterium]|nr:hypothetical protein [Bacteroidales bacterium]
MSSYEMVFCIVNAGFSEKVMDAAKGAGARGGTIIRGRGTANPEAEEFFHIHIQPEKEILLILVPAAIKDDVLRAVYKEAGLGSESQGIAFSLPVSRTAGLLE